MKKIIYYILTGLFIILPLSAKAMTIYPSDIAISPTPQTNNDYLYAEISGDFSELGFTLNSISSPIISNNYIDINFSFTALDGGAYQALEPFSYSVALGLLDSGDYSITANFYIDELLDSTINNTFTVSAVPLPAAAWLFISGILSILTLGNTSRKA